MAEKKSFPEHVAVILDGNGRWAEKRRLPRSMGHKEGCKTVEQIVFDAGDLGISYLTVYGFSTENWKRSEEEVQGLFTLFRFYMKRLLSLALANNVRVKFIGDLSKFPEDIRSGIANLIEKTGKNTGLTFTIALNYGARDELRRAFLKIEDAIAKGELKPEEITEKTISSALDTADLPDPDLLIRTGGEMRLSNYLLYQLAYTEIYVTDVLWPDFSKEELKKAIEWFQGRDRRFGGVKEKH